MKRAETDRATLLALLRAHLDELRALYCVRTLGIFGSYARDEQRKGSDLDLLVEFEEVPGLLKYIELEQHLSDLLGVKVDLVMKDALKPTIARRILREVVPV